MAVKSTTVQGLTEAQAYIANAKEELDQSGASLTDFLSRMLWAGKASETFKLAMHDYFVNYGQVLKDLDDIKNGVETARGHTARAAEATEAVAGRLAGAMGDMSPSTPALPLTSNADGGAVIGGPLSPATPGGAVANSPSTPGGGGLNLP